MENNSDDELLTVSEVARILRISDKTIYNHIGRKAKRPFPIKPRRVMGSRVMFKRADVKKYIDEL